MSTDADWQPPTLKTARLILRPTRTNDIDAIFRYASNPNVTRFTTWEAHRDRNDTVRFVAEYVAARYRDQMPDPLLISLREDESHVVGAIGAFWATRANHCMEFGYWLAEPFWGRGFATEAARALVGHLFAAYEVERVQAHYIEGNDGSGRVMEKVGLTREGILRRALLHRGHFRDIHIYSILRGEWERFSQGDAGRRS
jgi:[ribosomal protein S5]-alanine N-acetyltransferase